MQCSQGQWLNAAGVVLRLAVEHDRWDDPLDCTQQQLVRCPKLRSLNLPSRAIAHLPASRARLPDKTSASDRRLQLLTF